MGGSRQSVAGAISLASFRRGRAVVPSNRPFGNVPKRRSFLIVCEGERTEPNYFRAIARCLPRNMVENVVVEGVGATPDYLLKFAQEKISERIRNGEPPFYHVWLVFDRDRFEHFTETIENVARINSSNAEKPPCERPLEHWQCAWSNESFELWYVLHFREQLGGGVSREKYQEMIETDVRHCLGETSYRYRKNDDSMFARLYPFTVQAIERAKRGLERQVREHGADCAAMNPATTVHLLVRALLAYLKKGDE